MKMFKPGSVIFMIVAAVMIVAGVLLCIVGNVMAGKQNVELFADAVDSTGNKISTRAFSGKTVNKITIELNSGEVNIIGNSDKSGVEILNYALNSFEYYIRNNEMTLKDAGIFSVFHIAESGGTFRGLRHYLAIPYFSDEHKCVNVYLPSGKNDLSSVNIKLKSGNITVKDTDINCDYSLNCTDGDIAVKNVKSTGTCEILIKNGSLEFDENRIAGTKTNIEGAGGINCRINTQHSFTLETENGVIYLDSNNIGNKYSGVFPAVPVEDNTQTVDDKTERDDSASSESESSDSEKETNKNPMMVFYGKIKSGDMGIYLK